MSPEPPEPSEFDYIVELEDVEVQQQLRLWDEDWMEDNLDKA